MKIMIARTKQNLQAFCPSNEHDNHSGKTPTQNWRQVLKCSLDSSDDDDENRNMRILENTSIG